MSEIVKPSATPSPRRIANYDVLFGVEHVDGEVIATVQVPGVNVLHDAAFSPALQREVEKTMGNVGFDREISRAYGYAAPSPEDPAGVRITGDPNEMLTRSQNREQPTCVIATYRFHKAL